ncbi:MAG TPA: tetratricopeptide repeat protein [Pirellulales bacterium]|nr:tetratricopeptide repeat protein [Pirellulales bacterium]
MVLAIGALAPLLLVGCRLPLGEGPVSRSLAASRQLSHRGVNALERGDPQRAHSLLAEAVKLCPADAEARRNYGEALWQCGDRSGAVAQLDEALRLTPDDDQLHVVAGQMRLEAGDLAGALHDADEAMHLNPTSSTAWALHGRAQLRSGQPRQALNDLHRSLGLAPGDRDVLLALANAYRALNQPTRALICLQSLADTYAPGEEPQHVLYLQGLALAAMDRPNDAVQCFLAARDRGPPTQILLEQLAAAQQAAGRADDAQRTLAEIPGPAADMVRRDTPAAEMR